MKSFLKIVLAVSLLAMMFVAAACNTTKGVGKDIENAGAGLKNSAERNGAD